MTQVQTMTNPELNRALAELMGWKIKTTTDGEREFYDDGGFCSGKWVEPSHINFTPDHTNVWSPCTDPAASLEVQTAAIAKDKDYFLNNLTGVVAGYFPQSVNWDVEWENDVIIMLISASPRERAEAAYITLQGAKGNELGNITEMGK